MNSKALIIIAIIAVGAVAIAGIVLAMGGGEGPDPPGPGPGPEPEPPFPVDPVPEGYVLTDGKLSREDGRSTAWHIFDQLHAYMEEPTYGRPTVYMGYDEDGAYVELGPGRYTIREGGSEFPVTVEGEIHREIGWKWSMGGTIHDVSVSFDIDALEYLAEHTANKQRNDGYHEHYDFRFLPYGIVLSDVTSSAASQLSSEYARIGGSVSDRQGFADFVAAFIQLNIVYPPTVTGHSGEFDYYVWGAEEYWCTPMETLYHMIGDCDDNAALICALYLELGYETAIAGKPGHAFSGVHLDVFEEIPDEELKAVGFVQGDLCLAPAIESIVGSDLEFGDTPFYAVDSLQFKKGVSHPVGYISGGTKWISTPDKKPVSTMSNGYAGFYEPLDERSLLRMVALGEPVREPIVVERLRIGERYLLPNVHHHQVPSSDSFDPGPLLCHPGLVLGPLHDDDYAQVDEDGHLGPDPLQEHHGVIGAHVELDPLAVGRGDREDHCPASDVLVGYLVGVRGVADVGDLPVGSVEHEPHIGGIAVVRPLDLDLEPSDVEGLARY